MTDQPSVSVPLWCAEHMEPYCPRHHQSSVPAPTAVEPSPDVETVLLAHCIIGANTPRQGITQTIPNLQVLCHSCGWMTAGEYHHHLVAALRGAGQPEPSVIDVDRLNREHPLD
jgi:hypothetical protein